ncbi:putative S-layer protein [Candidatus Woesearchaeota archaeon]|nr:putative S-layer protein [Candidatus Woesearchaeota archaeon]
MKNKLGVFAILGIFLVLTSVIASITQISLTWPDSGSRKQAKPGESTAYDLIVRNVGDELVGYISFEVTDLSDNTNIIPRPVAPTTITNLGIGDEATVSFTVDVPSATPLGLYKGKITARYYYTGDLADWIDEEDFYLEVIDNGVTPQSTMTVDKSKVELVADAGESTTEDFTIRNVGTTQLTNIVIIHNIPSSTLEDSDGDKITLTMTPSTIVSLAPGASQKVDVKMDVDSGFDIDNIVGKITINAAELSSGLSLDLDLSLTSEIGFCETGEIGDLNIDLDEPEDDDDFELGDEIQVKGEVENNGDDEVDVVVEATLIDITTGEEIESEKTDEITIDEDETEAFDFKLTFEEEIDEDDTYKLIVKAYEKGDEDVNCVDEEVEVELDVPSHKLKLEKFELSPESIECGESTKARVDLKNLGSDDEDFTISLSNQDLNYEFESSEYNLEELGKDDFDTYSFTINIPDEIETGDYPIEMVVDYRSDIITETANLAVYCSLAEENATIEETTEESNTIVDSQNQPLENDETDTVTAYTTKDTFDDFELSTGTWIAIDLVVLLLVLLAVTLVLKKRKKSSNIEEEIEENEEEN